MVAIKRAFNYHHFHPEVTSSVSFGHFVIFGHFFPLTSLI